MSIYPKLASRQIVSERLPLIFPVGTPNRNNCIRGISASTVFCMLYVNAIEGSHLYCSPMHVYRMTVEPSNLTSDEERKQYHDCILKKGCKIEGQRWYEDNTRESIRDETIRDGLMQLGAIVIKAGVPTTSGSPRYALQKGFAGLFDPGLEGEALEKVIEKWQEENLSKSALTRLKINLRGENLTDKVLITFPNGETRHLETGPSSVIAKEVIEVFAKKFLIRPFVLWLSESGNKLSHRDDKLAKELGLHIDVSLDLPDIILVDITPNDVLLVFVEVVATDGAVTPRRIKAIYELTDNAGFKRSSVVFVTAYMDRQSAGFKKTVMELGWNSFLWFASEPGNLAILHEGEIKLYDVVKWLGEN
jgi:hypothetical protein